MSGKKNEQAPCRQPETVPAACGCSPRTCPPTPVFGGGPGCWFSSTSQHQAVPKPALSHSALKGHQPPETHPDRGAAPQPVLGPPSACPCCHLGTATVVASVPLPCLPRNRSNLPPAVCFPRQPYPALKRPWQGGGGTEGKGGAAPRHKLALLSVFWWHREGWKEHCDLGYTLGSTAQLQLPRHSGQQGLSWPWRLFVGRAGIIFPRPHAGMERAWSCQTPLYLQRKPASKLPAAVTQQWHSGGTTPAEPQPTPVTVDLHLPQDPARARGGPMRPPRHPFWR